MKARFSGYIASQTRLSIKQVLFLYGHRAVIMEEFADRDQWNAERLLRQTPKEAPPGNVLLGGRKSDGQSEPPLSGYFYGCNWLPE